MTRFCGIIVVFVLFLAAHVINADDGQNQEKWKGPANFADRNMLPNPEFAISSPWNDAQKQGLHAKITTESPEFAASWFVSPDASPTNARVKYSKSIDINGKKVNVISLSSSTGKIVLSVYFYNLPISSFPAGKYFQFGATAKGNGQITFGFFCYEKGTFRFIGGATAGTFALSENWGAVWSKPFDNSAFPAGTDSVAPYIAFSGDCDISSAALCEVSAEQQQEIVEQIIKRKVTDLPKTGLSAKLTAQYAAADHAGKIEFINGCPGDPDALPFLLEICKSQDNELVYLALMRIADIAAISSPDIVSFLIGKIQSPDKSVAAAAIAAVGALGKKGAPAVPFLANMAVTTSNEKILVCIVDSLVKIGPDAIPAIKELLLSSNKVVALSMATAVRGMNVIPDELKDAVDWANPAVAAENGSALANYSFEASDEAIPGWSFNLKDGAEGKFEIDHTRSRTGLKSLKITKTNGTGFISLRTAEPVSVEPGSEILTFRVHFQAANASPSSLLLLRFEDENGNLIWDDTSIHGGAGWASQSILRNTPGQFWDRRMIMIKRSKQPRKYFLNVILYGNPAAVWLDDIEFPATTWTAAAAAPTFPQPAVTLDEALKIINSRPVTVAKIETVNDHAVLKVNGKTMSPVLYVPTNAHFGDFKQMSAEGNINFQVVNISFSNLSSQYNAVNGSYPFGRQLWGADGKYDFSSAFRLLENAIRHCPDSNIVLGIYVEFPSDYVDKNPDQAWINAKGEKLYGTAMHISGFAEKLPTGMRWWPSPYSQKAMEAAGNLLREFVRELKAKPYSKIIAGTFIAGGHDMQFFLPERDYSSHCLAAWQQYLREKYQTDEALSAAWNKPGLTFSEAKVVPKKPEPAAGGESNEMFFSPNNYQPFADFNEFEGRMVWIQPEYYARIVKEEIGHNIFAVTWCMGGGWRNNFSYFLDSKILDGFVAQPFYEYRNPGYSGGLNSVYETFSRHGKIVVKELDTRNWMRGITDELDTMRIGTPLSLDHFKSTIYKEIGQMLAHYQGYWWYDIGANAYRHPEAMKVIRLAKDVTDEVFSRMPQDKFTPEVAFVYSTKSLYWGIPSLWSIYHIPTWCIDWMSLDLATAGVPAAHYFLEDVINNSGRISNAKVLVFVNTYYLTAAERDFINKNFKKDHKILVWHYSPGYVNEKNIDLKETAKLVNMNIETDAKVMRMRPIAVPGNDPLSAGLKPLQGIGDSFRCFFDISENGDYQKLFCQRFRINDPTAVTLAKYYEDGQSAIAVKRFDNYTSVFVAALGGLSPELLNNVAREAGAFVASRPGPVIDMNGNFISIHGVAGGKYTIKLPRTADVYNPFTRQIVAKQVDHFELEIMPQKSYWFILR